MKFAAIDVGTNSIHLMMVEISAAGDFRILGRDKEMVQLGKGGFVEHVLTEPAMRQGLVTLSRFVKLARLKGIRRIRAVATSAVREAANGGDFVERAAKESDLQIRVISAEEEARLIYTAVRYATDLGAADNLIVDVGGGSVEAILGQASRPDILFSAKLGALRLAELFLKNDPPTMAELKAMRRHIKRHLQPLIKLVGTRRPARCIGTSGTLQNIAAVCAQRRGLKQIDSPAQLRVTAGELKSLLADLRGKTAEHRMKTPGMDARRVDSILPALMLWIALTRMFQVEEIEYCDVALREGVVLDYIAKRRTHLASRATRPDARPRSVIQLAERCGYDAIHARQVARLALALYDQLQDLHRLDARYRELLEYGCLLHDIGYHISHRRHHKHSYYLIHNGDLHDFAEHEVEFIANLARYHRGRRPRKKDYSLGHLLKADRPALRKLIPLLRIANALDRTHYSVVESIAARADDYKVELAVDASKDAELELWTARRRKGPFEKEYRRRLEVRLTPSDSRKT